MDKYSLLIKDQEDLIGIISEETNRTVQIVKNCKKELQVNELEKQNLEEEKELLKELKDRVLGLKGFIKKQILNRLFFLAILVVVLFEGLKPISVSVVTSEILSLLLVTFEGFRLTKALKKEKKFIASQDLSSIEQEIELQNENLLSKEKEEININSKRMAAKAKLTSLNLRREECTNIIKMLISKKNIAMRQVMDNLLEEKMNNGEIEEPIEEMGTSKTLNRKNF